MIRLSWIDITKGLAIILMVIGHAHIPKFASDFIFAFHMPVFFMASGWCTNWSNYSFKELFVRRCKTLLIPFVVYSILVIIISLIIGESLFSLKKGWQGYALWFVPVLFLATLVAKFTVIIRCQLLRILVVLVCLSLGAALSYTHFQLPWALCTVPYAAFLILIGSILKKYESFISKPRLYILAVGLCVVMLISHFWRLDLAFNNITPVIPLTIGAISGAAMLSTIASYIDKGPRHVAHIFQIVGKETFAIMALSQILTICLNKLIMNPIIKYLALTMLLSFFVLLKNWITKTVSISR